MGWNDRGGRVWGGRVRAETLRLRMEVVRVMEIEEETGTIDGRESIQEWSREWGAWEI